MKHLSKAAESGTILFFTVGALLYAMWFLLWFFAPEEKTAAANQRADVLPQIELSQRTASENPNP